MMPQMMELSMKAGFGDEDSKKSAQKEDPRDQTNINKIEFLRRWRLLDVDVDVDVHEDEDDRKEHL